MRQKSAARSEVGEHKQGMSLMPVISAILGAVVALQVVIFFLHAYQAISFPYQLDYGEGPILQIAAEMARGNPMYPPVDRPPYIIASYEPAYYLISALGVKLFGLSFWWGRLVSCLSVVLTALFAGLIAWDRTKHRFASFLAGGTVLAMPHFMVWATLMRVDALALAFAVAGFWLFTRAARWAGMAPFSLGVFTRRTTVAGMGAAFLDDAHRRGAWPAAKGFAVQVAVIAALLVAADLATRGGMHRQLALHTATSLGKAWSWQQLWSLLWVPGNPCPLKRWPVYFAITVIAAVWSAFRLVGQKPKLLPRSGAGAEAPALLLWFVFACVIFLTAGRIGSAHNYLMEPTAVGAMMFGVMYAVLSRRPGRGQIGLMIVAGGLAAQMVWTTQHLPDTLSILQPRVDPRASQHIVDLIRDTDGPTLVEDTGLSLLAGKEPPLMPFEFTMMARAKALDPEPIFAAVREGRYPLVVLRFNPFDPLEIKLHKPGDDWKGGRWPDGIISGVQARYRLVEEVGPYFVFGARQLWGEEQGQKASSCPTSKRLFPSIPGPPRSVSLREALQVRVDGLLPSVLGAEDGFDCLTGGAVSPGPVGDEVGEVPDLVNSVSRRDRNSRCSHRLAVVDVVAHKGNTLQGDALLDRELAERLGLITHALQHIVDVQVAGATLDDAGRSPGHEHDGKPRVIGDAEPEAILDVEELALGAFVRVQDVASGENAVDIKHHHANGCEPASQPFRDCHSGLPSITARRAASMASTCFSTVGRSTRGSWVSASDFAFAGSGCTSRKSASMPTPAAARASAGTNSRSPPEDAPAPPGS
jgi:hypothetical protein